MFNVGSQELLIILFVVLLLFGAKRIPELARSFGQGMRELRGAMQGIEKELKLDLDEPPRKRLELPEGTQARPTVPPRNSRAAAERSGAAPQGEMAAAATSATASETTTDAAGAATSATAERATDAASAAGRSAEQGDVGPGASSTSDGRPDEAARRPEARPSDTGP